MKGPININISADQVAIEGLKRKIESDVRAAWIAGMDYAHTPFRITSPDAFSTQSLFAPWKFTVQCEGGQIERGAPVNHQWTVYRRPDMTEGELRRFEAGRRDWQDHEWQDHCGDPGCRWCKGNIPE